MISLSAVTSGQTAKLNRERNEIMHYGGNAERQFEYVDVILNTALPILKEFYSKAYALDLET